MTAYVIFSPISKIKLENMATYEISNIPPWNLSRPVVLKQLSANRKGETDPLKQRIKFESIR